MKKMTLLTNRGIYNAVANAQAYKQLRHSMGLQIWCLFLILVQRPRIDLFLLSSLSFLSKLTFKNIKNWKFESDTIIIDLGRILSIYDVTK